MATTEDNSGSTVDAQSETETTPDETKSRLESENERSHAITFVGRGPATRERGRHDERNNIIITDEVEVELRIEYPIEELYERWHASTMNKVDRGVANNFRGELRELVNIRLENNTVEVSYDDFDEWEITTDSDVRSWLELFEQWNTRSDVDVAEALSVHDELGDGFEAAFTELQRRYS